VSEFTLLELSLLLGQTDCQQIALVSLRLVLFFAPRSLPMTSREMAQLELSFLG